MSPGLKQLAADSEVAAVLVLTDGYISYPAQEPPYAVLWRCSAIPPGTMELSPPYGMVTFLDP